MIGWLGFSVLGLLFVAGALIWTGWSASPGSSGEWVLPPKLVPLLAAPVGVAVAGYGLAIWRAWRRAPAVGSWLIGVSAHLIYLVAGAAVIGEMNVADALTWDNLGTTLRLALPGILLLNIERSRIENPLR